METLAERIAGHRVAGKIPPGEIAWLVANGTLRHLEPGEVLTSKASGVVKGLFILLTGRVCLFVERPSGREQVAEWKAGDVTGVLPYSRLTAPPGDSIAQEPTDLVMIAREEIPALIRECHEFTSALVHVMVDRARHFTSNSLQAEKMASLGKLSAGLAHELNNPAAAIARSAKALHGAIATTEEAARALGALGLTEAQRSVLDGARGRAAVATQQVRSALEQADREAELEDWLLDHNCDPAGAGALAETAVTLAELDEIATMFKGRELNAALHWLGSSCLTRLLSDEIETAAGRISSLVSAVKGFTHMDMNSTAAPVDVGLGLTQTLSIHSGKARGRSVSVKMTIDPELPRVMGSAGELNQIWSNLLDNAIDAAGAGGNVEIRAAVEAGQVAVRVVDDGPGIPAEIRGRIFDPFFTTKKVGEGTGLGLDIVKKMVQKHKGAVTVESMPGRTEFRVVLPL